jgi:hypothetical protein
VSLASPRPVFDKDLGGGGRGGNFGTPPPGWLPWDGKALGLLSKTLLFFALGRWRG